jgi:phenylalanyl-tRNA synthetase beta chain
MQISYNWLKEFINFDLSTQDLEKLLTSIGLEVEGVEDLNAKYKGFYVAKVLECIPHPNADKLSLCKVELNEKLYSVVCGAPNVAQGQTVVFATAGSRVPSNGMLLDERKIRGEFSQGMICSEAELELGDDKSGIWVLPEDAPLGKPLAEYLNLNDYIFELSVTPNRADCLSHLGIAREIAAQLNLEIKQKDINIDETAQSINDFVKIKIEDGEKCKRYAARIVYDAKIQESPIWLKMRLRALGLRPINAAVDVTNLILMEVGQPLHAFDYKCLKGQEIIVRTTTKGEKFTTLDGKERTLDEQMLLICDAESPVAIGGVMGGENSEISDSTDTILIESAYFLPASVRRTAKKLAINSDSSYRFERGVDYDNVIYALERATELIAKLTGGKVAKGLIDVYPEELKPKEINLRYHRARKITGIDVSNPDIISMLKSLQMQVETIDDETIKVIPPSFRVDMNEEIDLVEEVARMYNYDKIEPKYISELDFTLSKVSERLAVPKLRQMVSDWMVHRGFNETITQNQMDPKTAMLFSDKIVELANPLGEELSVMRPSLIPSMLKTVRVNLRMSNNNLALFEIGKNFTLQNTEYSFIPGYTEKEQLCIAISGNPYPKQWGEQNRATDFYDIKGIISDLLDYLKITGYSFSTCNNSSFGEQSQSIAINSKEYGYLGDVSAQLMKHFDIEQAIYLAVIDLTELYQIEIQPVRYKKVPPFPGMTRDLAFTAEVGTESAKIIDTIKSNGGEFLRDVTIFDVYKGKNLGEGKISLAYSLSFRSNERTLQEDEIDKVLNKIISIVEKTHNVQLRKF